MFSQPSCLGEITEGHAWLDGGVCNVLYVTMSQASSEPAEHNQMQQGSSPLRDPYITCCYSAAPGSTYDIYFTTLKKNKNKNLSLKEAAQTPFAHFP